MKVRDCFDYDEIKRKMNMVVLRNFFLQKIVWNGERERDIRWWWWIPK